jgi:hypothetical protein
VKSSNILLAMVAKTVAPCLTSFQPVTIALKFSLCISHFWDPMQQEVSGCNALTRTVNPKVPGSRPERPTSSESTFGSESALIAQCRVGDAGNVVAPTDV